MLASDGPISPWCERMLTPMAASHAPRSRLSDVLQLVNVGSAPFLRPDLDRLVRGLGFSIEKTYPVRGTHR